MSSRGRPTLNIDPAIKDKIKEEYSNGVTKKRICEKYNISYYVLNLILSN